MQDGATTATHSMAGGYGSPLQCAIAHKAGMTAQGGDDDGVSGEFCNPSHTPFMCDHFCGNYRFPRPVKTIMVPDQFAAWQL